MLVKTLNDIEYVQRNFKEVQKKLQGKKSKSESHFEKLLFDSGLYFMREKANFKLNTRWSYYDFYIPSLMLYVELDGSSHDSEEQKEIDRQKEKTVRRKKRFILRIKNEEVLLMTHVNEEILLRLLFRQEAEQKGFSEVTAMQEYDQVVESERIKMFQEMQKSVPIKLRRHQIWMYDNYIHRYFCFLNICDAKCSVYLRCKDIARLCNQDDYSGQNNRRYVFAFYKDDCERRVRQAYGEGAPVVEVSQDIEQWRKSLVETMFDSTFTGYEDEHGNWHFKYEGKLSQYEGMRVYLCFKFLIFTFGDGKNYERYSFPIDESILKRDLSDFLDSVIERRKENEKQYV